MALRVVLAVIGMLLFALVTVVLVTEDMPPALIIAPLLLVLVGFVDLVIIVLRIRRGRR